MKRRAVALVQVLILLVLILLLALLMASSSLSQLQLSSRYAQRTQADCAARAGMAELVLKLRLSQPGGDISIVRKPLLDPFQEGEILLEPRPPLEGRVKLRRSLCVDNTSNPSSAASSFDGEGELSVPPFSASLVYEVELGRHTYLYESLLQQRWPYALACPGPILIPGRIGPSQSGGESVPAEYWSASSSIQGKILALETDVGEQADGAMRDSISVSAPTYMALYPFARGGGLLGAQGAIPPRARLTQEKRLSLGGPLQLVQLIEKTTSTGKSWEAKSYQTDTVGAKLEGDIELLENRPEDSDGQATTPQVAVAPGNHHDGKVIPGRRLGGFQANSQAARQRMRTLFHKPDTSSWPSRSIAPGCSGTIVVTSQAGAAAPDTYRETSGRLFCPGSLTPDLMSAYGYAQTGFSVQGALVLDSVSLAVGGDLNLTNYALKGSDATLIVDGTLTLDGGYLDAGENGLVIFCRRLVMKASGNFNGLIVVQRGAAIYGRAGSGAWDSLPQQPGLKIRGGLLVGGSDLRIDPIHSPGEAPGADLLKPLDMQGLTLVSADIQYEPRYLRGLNGYGNYEVLATELRN